MVQNILRNLRLAPLVVALVASTPSYGEIGSPVPADAVKPTPEGLISFFAGHTTDWGGGSAIYWAPNGTFRAINPSEQSVGFGRWYVTTASRMCYEGTWAWRQDFGVESREVEECTRYVIDNAGQVWSTTESVMGPWFPFYDDGMSRGDAVSASFRSLATTIGLEFR